jgi:phosphate-selective porin OprO/OprP
MDGWMTTEVAESIGPRTVGRVEWFSWLRWMANRNRPLLTALAILSYALLGWTTCSMAQEELRPTQPFVDSITPIPPAPNSPDEFRVYFRRLEERLDLLAKENGELARNNAQLVDQLQGFSQRSAPDSILGGYVSDGQNGGESPGAAGGGSKAAGGDPTVTGRAQEDGNRHRGKLPLKPYYDFDGDGFKFVTEDSEYSFGIRGMVQLDGRAYSQPTPGFASSGFYTPRSRFYLEGNLTKPIQYEFSFQQTFDSVNLLDAYVNFNYDPRLQFRLGRYKAPFSYEWYRIHIWDLLAPERSLFATNYEGQRRFGAMAWGTLLENRVEYAAGSFNTQRNGYQPFNSLQDVMAFVNFKPFYNEHRSFALRDLQFGGSVNAGHENQPLAPAALRTNGAPSGTGLNDVGASNAATVPFLAFNPGVTEHGDRALWELHTAWYYGGLTLLGAWQGGIESYAKPGGAPQHIPLNGWFLQAGYIFTGETIRDRTLVDPIRPFDLSRGKFGLGAFEPTARYSELTLDRRVFTEGLADPSLWTNQAKMVDVGVNWYLNKFVKVYFDWEHAMFANPVFSSNGPPQKSNDLFWVRTQVYF